MLVWLLKALLREAQGMPRGCSELHPKTNAMCTSISSFSSVHWQTPRVALWWLHYHAFWGHSMQSGCALLYWLSSKTCPQRLWFGGRQQDSCRLLRHLQQNDNDFEDFYWQVFPSIWGSMGEYRSVFEGNWSDRGWQSWLSWWLGGLGQVIHVQLEKLFVWHSGKRELASRCQQALGEAP